MDDRQSTFQQRTADQGQRALQQAIELQRNAARMTLSALEWQDTTQRQGIEFTKSLLRNYLQGVESIAPEMGRAMQEGMGGPMAAQQEMIEGMERGMQGVAGGQRGSMGPERGRGGEFGGFETGPGGGRGYEEAGRRRSRESGWESPDRRQSGRMGPGSEPPERGPEFAGGESGYGRTQPPYEQGESRRNEPEYRRSEGQTGAPRSGGTGSPYGQPSREPDRRSREYERPGGEREREREREQPMPRRDRGSGDRRREPESGRGEESGGDRERGLRSEADVEDESRQGGAPSRNRGSRSPE
ncbi:hypothetical protein [Salinilacihabitans rarus]|uniref:hypothetical protein n=1 Tax=Salinilacihabitans rarus TaxID=2961596 RepID=UPI0020C89C0C|nr:hypothetical protein [Salinilacihabitans rarus]